MSNNAIPCRSALIMSRIDGWSIVDDHLARFVLPFADVMQMADRVMHDIRTSLQTDAEWVPVDWYKTAVALRWQRGDKQLELELCFKPWGFLVSLYPDYVSHNNFHKLLVGWQATRATSPYDSGNWPGGEPGALDVHRLDRLFHQTGLTFDDPVFDGLLCVLAKHMPADGEPTELVADVVAVTQNYLKELGV